MEPEVSQEEVCPQKVHNPYLRLGMTWVGHRENLAEAVMGKDRKDAIPGAGAGRHE